MKIVFMGTPDFSLQPLKSLVEAGHGVSLVLTREDKKRNRGELSPTPVKELAQELNIPVLTPSKMKDEALIERLKSEIARSTGILSNQGFIAKAPAAKIENEKQKLEAYQKQYAVIEERLNVLKK